MKIFKNATKEGVLTLLCFFVALGHIAILLSFPADIVDIIIGIFFIIWCGFYSLQWLVNFIKEKVKSNEKSSV